MNKLFIEADGYVNDCFYLANSVYNSGYIPDVVLGVWRGGSIPAMVIHEYLSYRGINSQSKVMTAKSYIGIGEQSDYIDIDISEKVLKLLREVNNILIVDDVVDSGKTIEEIYKVFDSNNISAKIKIATVYYKPMTSSILPDYYLYESDEWIVFPHELVGLNKEELVNKKLYIL